MRAVLLAGGRGQRLRPYTTIIPKPLVPIGERPIMEHIVRRLYGCGVRHVDVCLGHLGELIQTYFTQATRLPSDLKLAWHWEDEPLGTAGALKVVPDLDSTFIAMNGDILTTLDYGDLVRFHHDSGAVLTVAMHSRHVQIELGVIESSDGYITGYCEKPAFDYDVSMGIYVYEPRALAHIPTDGVFQFPDLVLALITAGEKVAAYRTDVEWYDVGTFDELEAATQAFTGRPDAFTRSA